MSDIPPNAMEMGKYLIDYEDLQKFKKLGSRADLDILRQVNQEYYQALNSTFIDSVAKGIELIYMGRAVPDFFEPDEAEENMMENNGAAENDQGQNVENEDAGEEDQLNDMNGDGENEQGENVENEDAGEANQLDEMNGYDENQPSTLVRTNEGYLNMQYWNPKIAYMFRKLEFKGSWIVILQSDDFPLYEIVTQLVPYITSLRLNTLPLASENPGLIYSEFLNQFTNLKSLEIDFIVGRLLFYTVHGMSIDEVEIGVTNLKLKPSITFYAEQNHRELLAKFGAIQNVSFNLHFDVYMRGIEDDSIIQTIAEIQNNSIFGQIKYNFSVSHRFFRNLNHVKAFTEICLKPQMENQIEKLYIGLNFDKRGFAEGDRLEIVNCLSQLSPLLTDVSFHLRSKPTWDILNHDLEWPKLTDLWLIGYNYPLEILKKCVNLKVLGLEIDQDVSIFHNQQQSEKESLKEYFGNLRQLCAIQFYRSKIGDKLVDGNELHEYFKEILPQRPCIRYYGLEGIQYQDLFDSDDEVEDDAGGDSDAAAEDSDDEVEDDAGGDSNNEDGSGGDSDDNDD